MHGECSIEQVLHYIDNSLQFGEDTDAKIRDLNNEDADVPDKWLICWVHIYAENLRAHSKPCCQHSAVRDKPPTKEDITVVRPTQQISYLFWCYSPAWCHFLDCCYAWWHLAQIALTCDSWQQLWHVPTPVCVTDCTAWDICQQDQHCSALCWCQDCWIEVLVPIVCNKL